MRETIDVAVIGGGQAGLATSYELTGAGVRHVVLERGRIGEAWRRRWDTFCLVTPNWMVQLPGGVYDGDDPEGFMPRDEIAEFLERYADGFGAPVREGVEVVLLAPEPGGGFALKTSEGALHAGCVVVATGAYQRPYRPPGAAGLPGGLVQLDVEGYRNEHELPAGKVLVVGSGQSGCQLAEELVEAGRDVFLACGRAPWAPRRFGGHDLLWWAVETGFLDVPVETLASPSERLTGNILATGHGGGHDLNLRTLRASGVELVGHFIGVEDGRARFAADLARSVAWGDERYRMFRGLVRALAAERSLPALNLPEPEPFDPRSRETVELAGLGAVVFAGGFRPGYGEWLGVPGALDELGFPRHDGKGASTAAPGLYFVGVHFLRKRKSSLLYGVGEDAALVAEQISAAASTGVT